MKKVFFLLLVVLLSNWATAQITDYSIFDKKFNFYVANDLGRNGYYDQKPIAELMGTMAEEVGPEFVVATGDIHHFEGVRSVNDPLWMTNYELIYSHPELMIDWFPVSIRGRRHHPPYRLGGHRPHDGQIPQRLRHLSRCLQAGLAETTRLD